jgi:hypothetical protein
VGGAGVEQLLRGGGVGQRHADRARAGQGQVQVLLVQLDAEARVEGALDHALAVHLEDALDAKPPISAWRTLAGSAPALAANSSASATASMFSATMIWLATLAVWPAPTCADQRDVLAHQPRTAA